MGWDKGRYYTRSRKVNGRVVREYLGRGAAAEAAAQDDAERRALRAEGAVAWKAGKAALRACQADIDALCAGADLLARAALLAAGFHQHKRQWRRKRV
jgi:hypothetical protein